MKIGDDFLLDISNPVSKLKPIELLSDDGDEKTSGKFDDLFNTVFSASNETSRELSDASRESTAKLVTGQLDDLTEHMVTGEKSSMAFELNLTVRNKVLDAYNEISKMQI